MRNFRFILIGYIFMCLKYGAVVYAQACSSGANQVSYGNGSWIGYVYDHNGSGNPVTNPFATYRGYVAESSVFDRDWSDSSLSCSAGSGNNFAVRYKMNIALTGTYTFTIGGDDGVRLSIDGGNTWLISSWADHSYTTVSSQTINLNGNYNLVFEYYEKSGLARVSFSYMQTSVDFLMPALTSTISSCSGVFYDSGGATSNYGDNENRTLTTVYPATCGAKLNVNFSSFSMSSTTDNLKIYNGNSTASTLLGTFSASSPGSITSTASDGSLTFVFTSNSGGNSAGWIATFNCIGVGTISGPGSLCGGDTATFHASYSGTNYFWTSGNIAIATINASTGLSTLVSGGNSVITYTNYYNSITLSFAQII